MMRFIRCELLAIHRRPHCKCLDCGAVSHDYRKHVWRETKVLMVSTKDGIGFFRVHSKCTVCGQTMAGTRERPVQPVPTIKKKVAVP